MLTIEDRDGHILTQTLEFLSSPPIIFEMNRELATDRSREQLTSGNSGHFSASEPRSLLDLPIDCLRLILRHFTKIDHGTFTDLRDACRLRLVCRKFCRSCA